MTLDMEQKFAHQTKEQAKVRRDELEAELGFRPASLDDASIAKHRASPLRDGWVNQHRAEGHHPVAAPTEENPERWDCDCHHIWRIHTPEQIHKKYAHLRIAKEQADNEAAQRIAVADLYDD